MERAPSEVRLMTMLIIVQVLFAGISVAGKLVLPFIPPLGLALCRMIAAATVLMILDRVLIGAKRPPLRDLAGFAFLALLGVVLNQGLFLTGLKYTTATNAVLLVATIPAFTMLVAAVLGHERATMTKVLGLALSFGGIAVLVGRSVDLGFDTVLGNVMILANALSYSAYLVLSRPYLSRHDPLTVIAWTFLFGLIEMAAFGVPALARVDWPSLTPTVWAAFAYILVGATIISYGVNNWVLRYVTASRVASFVYLQPLVGVLLAALILSERLTWTVALAGVLIIGGVAVANRVAPSRRAATGA